MADKSRYWFPAKQYGWGWGPPASWQGWVVMAVYVVMASLTVVSFQIFHRISLGENLVLLVVLTAGLMLICWLKGEPPRWRWGKN